MGIAPSVDLLCHFFSLHLVDPRQSSGCVSFHTVAETAGSGIDFDLPPSAGKFRTLWVYVDVGALSPLLSPPSSPAIPNSGWGHEKLASPCLVPVWLRLKRLKDRGVTAPMVVKEFVRRRVAPLQRHSWPMWALLNIKDHMRLQESGLPLEARQTVLGVLAGVPLPDDMPRKSCLLYRCSNKEEFVEHMPSFDEWGLCPYGLVGPARTPSAWFLSSLLAPSSPRVWMQGACTVRGRWP